ncbi:MAG: P22 coat protein, partial [Clostridia bacterium]|nr:P22 coat protein [Clostridia bacterium]
MSNTFVTLKTIARQALPLLQENLVFPNLVYRDFDESLHNIGDTVRVRRPTVFRAEDFDPDAGVSYQDFNEDAVDVTLDHIATVDASATAIESATS